MREESLPESLRTWLLSTADVIAGRDAFEKAAGGWSPTASSHATWELETAEAMGWGDPPGSPPAAVHSALIDWFDMADGYLDAMEALFRSGRVAHVVPALARGLMEHCHKICWLLEPTQDVNGQTAPVTLEDRSARAYIEELFGLRHRRDTMKKLSGRSSVEFQVCAADYEEMRTVTIPTLFPGAQTDGKPEDWLVSGQRWRGPTTLAERYSANKEAVATKGAYDALCAMTHPTLYAIREFIQYEPVGELLRRRRLIAQDFLERIVGASMATYWRASLDAASYFGWDRQPLDEWAHVLNDWRSELIAVGV